MQVEAHTLSAHSDGDSYTIYTEHSPLVILLQWACMHAWARTIIHIYNYMHMLVYSCYKSYSNKR